MVHDMYAFVVYIFLSVAVMCKCTCEMGNQNNINTEL